MIGIGTYIKYLIYIQVSASEDVSVGFVTSLRTCHVSIAFNKFIRHRVGGVVQEKSADGIKSVMCGGAARRSVAAEVYSRAGGPRHEA